MTECILEVADLETGYGGSTVLHGVELNLRAGAALALMGRNGMGKTTTIRTIMGTLPIRRGTIHLAGRSVAGLRPHDLGRLGVGWVPEGRRIFPRLTVDEHLQVAARPGAWTRDRLYALLPAMAGRKHHRGSQLSGGEQQMLAIGRALSTNPRLLLLDEVTEGLAPLVRAEIWSCLQAIKQEGVSLLVVDQDLSALAKLAETHLVLERGRVAWRGDRHALARDRQQVNDLLAL